MPAELLWLACEPKVPEQSWKAYVLYDATIIGSSPSAWANIAVKAFHHWGAQRVIAEVNQGGDLVEAVLRQVAPMVPYKAVRAKIWQINARRTRGCALRTGAGVSPAWVKRA
jgi:phage terminase large subunit-like protein